MASKSHVEEAEQEHILVSKAIDGDADAFGLLYTEHLNAIYRYVYFRVANVHVAEDLTEEVFIKAWTALPEYKPQGHRFTSWLYRIAKNLVIDHYRKQASRFEGDAQGLHRIPDSGQAPEEQFASQEEHARLARAIQQLGDDEQHVIILRFVEGLSHREVAEAIGKSEGASRVIQHRALESLAGIMGANG